MRRDHTPGPSPFKGSGLPSPEKGSRRMASTRRRTRRAIFRSRSIQYTRSSRNWGSNTDSSTECLNSHWLDFVEARAGKGGQQPGRIRGRRQQVRGFGQAVEFFSGDENDISAFATANAYRLPIGHRLIAVALKPATQLGKCG